MGRASVSLLIAIAACAALGVACSDEAPKRPPVLGEGPASPPVGGGGTGGGDGGVRDSGGDSGDAGSCTSLDNSGDQIDQSAVNDELPAGTGGTVLDGVYNLTEARVYLGAAGTPGPTGIKLKETIRITGTAYERVLGFTSSGGSSEIRSSGSFTQTGTTGVIALTCPSQNQEQVTYTVGNNILTVSNIVTKESYVFLKQP